MSTSTFKVAVILSALDKMTSVVDGAVNRAQARMRSLSSGAMEVGRSGLAVTAGIGAAMAMPIKQAVEFETGMANIKKVVGELKDETAFKEFSQDILKVGREIPLTYKEITELAAAGGRMDVPKAELIGYTKEVAKMATAFDAPTDQIGEQMGKLAKGYEMPISQIGELGDVINYLDDNAIAKGADIIEVMSRMAGQARQVGLSTKSTAALASTFLTLGSSAEVAATAGNAMLRELAIAEMQPKRFQEGLKLIGMSAKEVQKNMAIDPEKTLLGVLDAVNKLPKEKQTVVSTMLMGKEYGDDFAKIAQNNKEYRRQIALANSSEAKGSMQREYETRMKTTAAQMKLFQNNLAEVGITIGNAILPALNDVMKAIRPYIDAFRDWAAANPELVAGIAKLAAVIAATSLATSALSFMFGGVLKLFPAGLSIFKALRTGVGVVSGGFKLLTKVGGLFTGVLGGIVKAFGFVGTALRALTAAFMTNPIGIAIAAIATAVYLIYEYWGEIKGFFSNLWEGTKSVFSSFTSWVGDWAGYLWEKGKGAMHGLWEGMKGVASSIGDWFASWWESDIEKIASRINYNGTFGDAMKTLTTGGSMGLSTTGGQSPEARAGSLAGSIIGQMQRVEAVKSGATVNAPTTNNQSINFSPTINVTGTGAATSDIDAAMKIAKERLKRELDEMQARKERKSFE